MPLSIAIAQTQTEHDSSPAITICTTKLACQARSNNETPELIAGSDAPSGIGNIPSTQWSQFPRAIGLRDPAPTRSARAVSLHEGAWFGRMGGPPKPGLHSPANMSKRGLFARLYASNQTLIRVKTRLPKDNPDEGSGGRP